MIRPMFPNTLVLVPTVLFLAAAVASAQTTWYVDAGAAPGGNGSPSQPFETITQAAGFFGPAEEGDTVLVAPGTYAENVWVTDAIQLIAPGGPLVTVIRPSHSSSPTLELEPSGGALVRGFTILSLGGTGAQAVDLSSNVIERCLVIGGGTGIGIEACSSAAPNVRHCTVTRFGYGVLDVAAQCTPHVSHCIVYGNGLDLAGVQAEYTCYGTEGSSAISPSAFVANPSWLDASALDLHLQASSACIDAGDPAAPTDPDGTVADLGALPFDPAFLPVVAAYCTAKTNSLGCVPSIAAVGLPSATTPVEFTVHAIEELNQRNGLFFWGFAPKNAPYQGGFLCVQSPVRRSSLLNSGGSTFASDCTGVFSIDFNEVLRSGADPLLVPSAVVYGQFWSRDPSSSFSTNRSDALRFTVQP